MRGSLLRGIGSRAGIGSGGRIVDDFDNDGLLDIVALTWSPSEQLRYFRNNGDRMLRERTEEAGFEGLYGGLTMVHTDHDGNLDILVFRGAWLSSQNVKKSRGMFVLP